MSLSRCSSSNNNNNNHHHFIINQATMMHFIRTNESQTYSIGYFSDSRKRLCGHETLQPFAAVKTKLRNNGEPEFIRSVYLYRWSQSMKRLQRRSRSPQGRRVFWWRKMTADESPLRAGSPDVRLVRPPGSWLCDVVARTFSERRYGDQKAAQKHTIKR